MKRITVLLAALGALLLVSAAPAFAGELEFKETFGSAEQPSLGKPFGMAVDPATGDLYVIDGENQTLSRFKPNGEPDNFSAIEGGTSNVIDGAGGLGEDNAPEEEIFSNEGSAAFETEVAVAPPSAGATAGDIYVTNAFDGEIDVFAPTGAYLGNFTGATYPCGVAVDSAGKVFVGSYEGEEAVYKLNPTSPGNLSEVAQFPTTTPCQVAAGSGPSAGYVFAASLAGQVTKLDATSGEPKYVVSPLEVVTISVDSGTGYLYANMNSGSNVIAFDVSGAEATEVSSTHLASALLGVAINGSTHDVYLARSNVHNVSVFSQPAAPTVGPPLNVSIESGSGTVVSNPAGIECTGSAPHSCTTEEIAEGAVTLTASPAAGYAFKSWKGCDKKAGEFGVNGRQCTIDLNGEKSVSAKFVKVYDLTLDNGGNGKISSKPGGALCLPNCSETTASFEEGKTVEVLAKANKHFHLASWGGDCSGTGSCSLSMGADHTVSATFAEDAKFTLAISKTGGGSALIKTKGPGTVCSYTCSQSSASFYTGEEVLVSWKLNKGTSSLTWTTGAGTCTGTHTGAEGSCTVTMSAAKSLVAELE